MKTKFDASAVATQILASGGDDCDQSKRLAQMFPGLMRSSRWRDTAMALWDIKFAARRMSELREKEHSNDVAYL